MIGKRIGGTNVFGGGLPLYDAQGKLLGGLGVSGDASCADHNIAWKVRYNLHLDFVPAGVADPTTNNNHGDDNIIYDINPATGVSASGFGHPECSARPQRSASTSPIPTSVRSDTDLGPEAVPHAAR